MREAPTCNRRHLLAVGLAAAPFIVRPCGLALAAERRPRLSGTFLQLLTEHHTWRAEQWVRLFDAFRRLSLSRSEEHTPELQSPCNLVCRLLLEKKNASWLLNALLRIFAIR